MDNEMKSLGDNQTWELANLPEGVKAYPYKWVYKVKTNSDGSIDKYKLIKYLPLIRFLILIFYCMKPIYKLYRNSQSYFS